MALEDYKDVVGNVAFVMTMAHMLSGTLICKDIYKKGSSRGFDPMPFIGGIGMCILMLRYALIVKDPAMININLFGITINIVCMAIYYLYDPDKVTTLTTLGKATAFVAMILGYAQVEHEDYLEHRYGMLTTALFLMLIASPLMHLGEIIRTKSTAMLPFPLIFMGTIVAFLWLLYGLIINNSFIIFQNAIGFSLSFVQLSLFAIYPCTPVNEDEKPLTDKKKE
ncbi:hypothetical protein QAD02_011858 [Eretmocerus hayati]|uniref:Uncharacterized protein n=1 Tax=Eretmocerus hayati TaxID=131215 RepID=A0ACC2NY74_9HYME|nr:hypothetical protein QAD02_011858 [Eretmocerus hayati]